MALVLTDSTNYDNIADAIRAKNGETTEYYPNEMAAAINGIAIPDTLVAANGDVAALRLTDQSYTVLTATANDIRIGTTAITENGTITGTKEIPSYRTYTSKDLIIPGSEFSISGLSNYDLYDYTEFYCIISKFNTTLDDSIYTDKISINDKVFQVESIDPLSSVTKNADSKSIDLNITNNSEDMYVIHSFMFREEID